MSTLTTTLTPPLGADRRPSFSRLTLVELRKTVNTRSGFWVPIAVALLTLLVAIIVSVKHGGHEATLTHVLHAAAQPAEFLLPVLGVLLICGEWTQRTTLTTFTLVPSRTRVIAAKVAASVLVSTVGLIVSLLCTLLCVSIFGNAPGGAGGLSLTVLGQGWIYLVAAMLMGLGFGAAILASAPAIVAYLLLPTVWDAVVGNIGGLGGVAKWLDQTNTLLPMTQHNLSGTEWLHALATLAVWVGIPILAGALRLRRGDID